jgi:hypothetical protein
MADTLDEFAADCRVLKADRVLGAPSGAKKIAGLADERRFRRRPLRPDAKGPHQFTLLRSEAGLPDPGAYHGSELRRRTARSR